jgi:hypothetical protein
MRISVKATLLAAASMLVLGCESDTRPVSAPPVQQQSQARPVVSSAEPQTPSLDAMRAHLVTSKRQIQSVLGTLSQITDPKTPAGDLSKLFKTYSDQLADINDNSKRLHREADAMRASQQAYFAKWEDKMTQIDNPSIRASAEERKTRLRAEYDRITSASIAAKEAYDPFMRDLEDLRKYLAKDLTPTGTAMLGDVSKKSSADGAVVQSKIDALIAELDTANGSGR